MKSRAFLLIVTLAISTVYATAQQSVHSSSSTERSADPKARLHEDALSLVELTGARDRLKQNEDKMFDAGQQQLAHDAKYDPAFAAEWRKRMQARFNPHDYIGAAAVYEKHFDDQELTELIQAQRDRNDSKTPTLSQHLQEKLPSLAVLLQSEILGACTQIGALQGGEVGQQIAKEHPEWIKASKATDVPAAKQ